MKLIFISDLHLSDQTPDNNRLFFTLMQQWQNEVDGLYILGDFFDFWCGDDDDNEFIRSMKDCLKTFSARKPVYFMIGNHDFAIGKRFARDTGIQIIQDMTVLKIAGNTILLSHGDTFCTLDIAYQRLKSILQNRFILSIILSLPLSWRYKIKDKLEHKSGENFNTKPQETYHVVDQTVIEYANKYKANVVIHGHTHRPNCYTLETPQGRLRRFEIPDWVDRKSGGYVILDNEKIEIHTP